MRHVALSALVVYVSAILWTPRVSAAERAVTDNPRLTNPPARAATSAPPESLKGDNGRSIEHLIDKLAEISHADLGYATNVTGSKFSPLDDAKPPSRFYEGPRLFDGIPSETMRQLVAYGADAVPRLVSHLGDKRKTRLFAEHGGFLGDLFAVREYDYNRRTVKVPPRHVVHPDDSDLEKELERDFPEKYTVTTGDLCFVALGQIVNREFMAVRYQPTGCVVVCSPSYSSTLRAAVVAEWAATTRENHRASLLADVRQADSGGRAYGALQRLSFYYPDAVEQAAIEQLRKPHYSLTMVYRFADDVLYKTTSADTRKRLVGEFLEKHGKAFSDGLLLQLVSDYEWDKGTHFPPREFKADPRKILAELYPRVDPKRPLYPESEPWGDQAFVFDALAHYPSQKMDRAAYDLFKELGDGRFDAAEDDRIAIACMRRLGGKGHDEEFEGYLLKRIAATRDWHVDTLKAALALLRGETFYLGLEGPQVTDAELARLKHHKNLQRLALGGPQVTDDRLKCLQDLPSIEYLALSGANVTDKGLSHVRGLEHLETLILHCPGITDAGMAHLRGLRKLRFVDVSGASITDAGLGPLEGLRGLERLVLNGFTNETRARISKERIQEFRSALPNCRID